jgi:hypothetical protein
MIVCDENAFSVKEEISYSILAKIFLLQILSWHSREKWIDEGQVFHLHT